MRKMRVVKLVLCTVFIFLIDGLFHCPVLRAMPRFMEWYAASPYAKAELKGRCTICHVRQDGFGPLTEFGEAFADQGYRFTAELRQAYPQFFAGGEEARSDAAAAEFDAKAFFAENCAACHGEDGKGGPAAAALNVPDFSDGSWQQSRTNAQLAETIKNGRGAMPAWDEKLNDEQIKAMVNLVREFAQ